jgi:hypothetical protein
MDHHRRILETENLEIRLRALEQKVTLAPSPRNSGLSRIHV